MTTAITPRSATLRATMRLHLAGCALGAFLLPGVALAQQGTDVSAGQESSTGSASVNEDIIVTAQRTGAQSLQKTPIAISAFTAQQLEDRQATNIKDMMQYTPNLQVSQAAANALIFIRGIGTTNTYAGSDPDVTTQVDGVYIARPSAQLGDFFDVERVEILRGPQGTLYGRNAAGGTINVISRKPGDDFAARLAVTAGDYGLVQTQGYVSGPLIPGKLQVSLSGNYLRHNGYIENIAPGGHDIDSANRGAVRGQIRLSLGSVEAITRGDWYRTYEYIESYDQLLARVSVPAPLANSTVGTYRKVALDLPQLLDARGGGVSQEINIGLAPSLSLKSITAYRESHYIVSNDSDATELNLTQNRQTEDQHQFSQEVALQYNGGGLAAVAGAYYFRERIVGSTTAVLIGPGLIRGSIPDVVAESKAVFAQGSYNVTDALRVTLGARYTWEEKSIDPYAYTKLLATGGLVGLPFTTSADRKYHAFTPKFGIDYRVTPDFLIYGSITRGFKSGGFNYSSRSLAALDFAPETIWSYEAGIKSDWLDRRLRVNLTGFVYDYKGLQVQALLSPGNAFIGNADSAKVKGVELEVTAKPVPNLTLTSNASYLDARYGSFTNAAVVAGAVSYVIGDPRYNAATTSFNATGNRLNAAPRFSTLQAIQYDIPTSIGTIAARGEFSWQGKVYYDVTNVNVLSQPEYGLLNLALGWKSQSGAWRGQLLVRNVTDKQYLNSAAAPGAYPTGHAGPPRTVSVTISRSW
ncbi:MAG: TonB-dependent receptor [Candidatus Sphingomonas phytovorans]|nr:TonB-dependent receptor [Sphingomonas sp.]WEK02313.1 MAG: TonB-dependent receptor [Sphingomonas sp.]